MPSIVPPHAIEEQIHKEFRAAFDELERTSGKEKEAAAARLNRAVRQLYDFVGYGKVPQDLAVQKAPLAREWSGCHTADGLNEYGTAGTVRLQRK